MTAAYKKALGFTLVELLITLLVLSVLLSIGVTNYTGLFSQQVLTQTAERVYHFLRLAETEAISRNKIIYVHFCQSQDTQQWKMAMTDLTACDCFSSSSCLLSGNDRVEELSDGKTLFADINFAGEQASYKPMRFHVNIGNVTLTDISGNQLKVIQGVYRLRICSPNKAQLGYKKC
ncbi:MAG: GspH/FimT family protein [Psychromonas sp.]